MPTPSPATAAAPPGPIAAARPAPLGAGTAVLILSVLLGLQPVTTDLYLPALPALTEGFGAPMPQAQLTLTALLLAFGLSQLVWGPLSDRFGRRPVLLLGLSAYVIAAVACALAPTMHWLIVGRTVQGVAMGAGVMAARAIVRDLYQPAEGARVLARALSGLAVFACISAPLGGLLSDLVNWRAALMALAVFGALALALVALRFRETIPQRNPHALSPGSLWRNWWLILRHPGFLAWCALSVTSYGALFTFLAASSFVFIQVLGIGKTHYGLLMCSMSAAYLAGTLGCRRLLPRVGARRLVAWACALSLASSTAIALFAMAGLIQGPWGVWYIMLPFYLFMLAHGVHQPCGQSGSVAPFPQAAGAASALNGFLMMVGAFLMGGWLGTHMDGSVRPLTHGIWFWGALIALSGWTLVWRYGVPPEAPAGPGSR